MRVVVHPLAAYGAHPGERLRVWVGVFGADRRPELAWRLDGTPADPRAVRPLRGARPADLVSAGEPRAFTGVYELADVAPGTVHRVEAAATLDDRTVRSPARRIRTPAAEVPHELGESFNVLLVSCFYHGEDGRDAGRLVEQLPAPARPDLTLLLGDQVYLDLPLIARRRNTVAWLAEKFEKDYAVNWDSELGYPQVLSAAPNAMVPDDHEYWNNAPHAATLIPLTYNARGRGNWFQAAKALFDAFQLSEPGAGPEAYNRWLDVAPLSFFLMDNRTFRQPDLTYSMHPHGLERFQRWADRVVREQLVGVVVTGQSLWQEPASLIKGKFFDRHLANYGDYPAIMAVIAGIVRAGSPVLCVTGDVHYGRVTEARLDDAPGNPLYEVISSPSSLIPTPLRRSGEGDWPRHREPQLPPDVLVPAPGGAKWKCRMRHGVRGNHVALLSFRRSASGVRLEVTYHLGRGHPRQRWGPVTLRSGR